MCLDWVRERKTGGCWDFLGVVVLLGICESVYMNEGIAKFRVFPCYVSRVLLL